MIVLLAFGAAVGQAAESPRQVRQIAGPAGYHLAQAELSRNGDGFVLWKAATGLGAVLERYVDFKPTWEHSLADFLAQGFLRSGDRLLLQGQGPEGRSLRLVEVDGDSLRPLWSSDVLLARGVDRDEVAVSRDLEWWYVPQYGPTTVLVRAGRIGESDSLHWTVDVEGADPFSASVTDVTAEPAAIALAFSARGEGWWLEQDEAPRSLARPPECDAIHALTGAADGVWADCDRGTVALYPARPQGDGPVEAVAVDRVTDLRFLPSGRAVGVVLRHGAPGRLTSLTVEERQLRRGPEIPFSAVLGQGWELAGEVVLIEVEHGTRSTPARFRVRPLPSEAVGPVAQ